MGTITIESGRTIKLPEDRAVFVAMVPDRDMVAICFRSSDGELTKLSLSEAAAMALARLITDPCAGSEGPPPSPKPTETVYRWKAVIKTAEDITVTSDE